MSEQAERASGLRAAPAIAPGIAPGIARVGYAPITRVDAERREIELCATSEALDAHGTIFDYAASKEAFTRWLGNVREMHERRAVGRRVAVRCDDEARRVFVRLRISRGAQDTWEKVLDGTLRGASIGASDVVWRRERRTLAGRSRWVNVATRYDLAELSLVDNPSNPDALGVTFVRNAAPDLTLLDPLETPMMEEGEEVEAVEAVEEAANDARAAEMASPVEARERQPLHEAARALLTGCGCPLCAVALAALADDAQTDDALSEAGETGEMRGGGTDAARTGALTRALAAGLRINAARLGQFDATLNAAVVALHQQAERAATERATLRESEPSEQAAQAALVVEELRARVARLEAQPLTGGPAAHPVEKTLGVASLGSEPGGEFRALEALAGRLRDPQAQLAVAAEMIRLQQRGE